MPIGGYRFAKKILIADIFNIWTVYIVSNSRQKLMTLIQLD